MEENTNKAKKVINFILGKLPKLTIPEVIVLVLAFGFYLFWASLITVDSPPATSGNDEWMRFMIPDYIYQFNRLPTGFDPEVIYERGGWSYAFYPQFLGPILSAFFMHLASLFRTGSFVLIFAARMTSVLAGIVTVFFVNRTLRVFTGNKMISLLGMILIAFWPQFAFLSGYINNDIIPVAGVSIMCYAVAVSHRDTWTKKSSATLAIGMSICLLSYLNSAGFVLAFGIYFLISNYLDIKKKQIEWKAFWKRFTIVFVIVAILWFPFLIRNAIIYDGDMLGMRSFNAAKTEWEQNESMNWAYENARAWSEDYDIEWHDGLVYEWVSIFTFFEYRGGYFDAGHPHEGNLVELFQDSRWRQLTTRSFVTNLYFAYVAYFPVWLYIIYGALLATPLLGISRIRKLDIKQKGFMGTCLLGSFITIGLWLYYNLYIDSQPQGRYFITVLVPLIFGMAIGIHTAVKKLPQKAQRIAMGVMISGYMGLLAYVFGEFLRLRFIIYPS
jgi:hypothetical protein